MDRALEIMAWLRERSTLRGALPDSLGPVLEPVAGKSDTLIYLGEIADLDLLLSLVIPDWRLKELVEDAVRLLVQMGIRVWYSVSPG